VLCRASPALVRRADGECASSSPAAAARVLPDIQLADVRFRLTPGDTLLLYTDGATEARQQLSSLEAARPLFGEDALAEALAGTHAWTPRHHRPPQPDPGSAHPRLGQR